jgi:hypothetical protein
VDGGVEGIHEGEPCADLDALWVVEFEPGSSVWVGESLLTIFVTHQWAALVFCLSS